MSSDEGAVSAASGGAKPTRTPIALIAAGGLMAALGSILLQWVMKAGDGVAARDEIRLFALADVLLGAVLMTAALGVLVFRPVSVGPSAAAAGFGTHRVMLLATAFATLLAALVGSVVPLLVFAVTGQRDIRTVPGFLAAAASVSLALLGVAYFRFIRPGVVSWRDLAFGRNRQAERFGGSVWLAHLATGFGGGLLILLLSGAVQAVLRGLGVEQTQLRDFTWLRELPLSGFLLIVLAGALLAPLAEEVFFRGIVFRSYLLTKGPLVAYIVSSAVFGLLHLNLQAALPIMVLGAVLAWLTRATGSLAPAVLAHGFNNGVAFMALYFAPRNMLP